MTINPRGSECTGVDSFHSYIRQHHPLILTWTCVYCGKRAIGRMPAVMQYYLIEEEPA